MSQSRANLLSTAPDPFAKRRVLVVTSMAVLMFAAVSYFAFDIAVLCWAMERPPVAMDAAAILTRLADSAYSLTPLGIITILAWWRGARRIWHRTLFAFAAIAIAGLLNNAIKLMLGRMRPNRLILHDGYGFDPPGIGYDFQSMPSGHACVAGAIFIVLATWFPRYRWWLLVPCLAIASTRMLTFSHYLSDVVLGFWCGILFALAVRAYFTKHLSTPQPISPTA